MSVHINVKVCTHTNTHAQWPEEGTGSLESDLQEIVSCPACALSNELWASAKAAGTLNCRTISLAPMWCFWNRVSHWPKSPKDLYFSSTWIISLCHHAWLGSRSGVLLFFLAIILPTDFTPASEGCILNGYHEVGFYKHIHVLLLFWLSPVLCFSGQERTPFVSLSSPLEAESSAAGAKGKSGNLSGPCPGSSLQRAPP